MSESFNATTERKINLAKKFLKNTPNIFIKADLEEYIQAPASKAKEFQPLDKVLAFILEDGYSMENFGLFEIPIEETYCFVSNDREDCFDIYVHGDSVTAGFIHDSNETDAPSIKAAIRCYKGDFDKKGANKNE